MSGPQFQKLDLPQGLKAVCLHCGSDEEILVDPNTGLFYCKHCGYERGAVIVCQGRKVLGCIDLPCYHCCDT